MLPWWWTDSALVEATNAGLALAEVKLIILLSLLLSFCGVNPIDIELMMFCAGKLRALSS